MLYCKTMPKDELKQRIHAAMERAPHRDRVRRVSLFGSYLYGAQTVDSDIDLLVEFAQPIGYFGLTELQQYLEQTMGHHIDLVTPDALSKYFRDGVLRDAERVYER